MSFQPIPDDAPFDMYELNRELDRTKSKVFLGKSAAFLGSLMSSMNFIWTESIPTAATDGVTFWWNPKWFLSLKEDVRKTVLVHELWHPARLHLLRIGSRDPTVWNYACDIRINNDLENEGYSFEGTHPWKDQSYGLTPEEDIYDDLISKGVKPPPGWGPPDPNGNGGTGDMIPMSPGDKVKAVNNVVKAVHQAKLAGQAGSIPGDVEQVLKQFLAPVIDWRTVLYQFFSDLMDEDFSWRRPNRRHDPNELYLPAKITDDGRLEHLIYYLDVSGSISDQDLIRFNSEVKYIKDVFNPQKLTLVQFDTRISHEQVIEENDAFDEVKIVGRGGTCLIPVREHIIENRPTAAIIFSDLHVPPMEPLPSPIPVIWVAIGNKQAKVPFGKLIHIKG